MEVVVHCRCAACGARADARAIGLHDGVAEGGRPRSRAPRALLPPTALDRRVEWHACGGHPGRAPDRRRLASGVPHAGARERHCLDGAVCPGGGTGRSGRGRRRRSHRRRGLPLHRAWRPACRCTCRDVCAWFWGGAQPMAAGARVCTWPFPAGGPARDGRRARAKWAITLPYGAAVAFGPAWQCGGAARSGTGQRVLGCDRTGEIHRHLRLGRRCGGASGHRTAAPRRHFILFHRSCTMKTRRPRLKASHPPERARRHPPTAASMPFTNPPIPRV